MKIDNSSGNVAKSIMKQRQEILNDSVAGGMMGGYIAEGFPFYFINKRMLEYLGYESEEEFVKDIDGLISNCIHPDDRGIVDKAADLQIKEKGEYVVEYRMKKKDGSYIWVHDLGRKMEDEEGRPVITSACMDITKRHKIQEEAERLWNTIPGAVFRCRFDEDFSVLNANDGLFEFLGYTREEFAAMGNKMSSVIYPDDLETMTDKLLQQLKHSSNIYNENRLICKDGTVKWIFIKGQLVTESDGQQYFYCVFVDITESKEMQERTKELYEKELAYFSETSSSKECIQGRINVTRNRVENYMFASQASVARVGDAYDQVVFNLAEAAVDREYGKKIAATLKRQKVLEDYARGETSYRFEFLRRRNDGSLFWSNTNLRTYMNPETKDIIVFFYTFDITEQKVQLKLLEQLSDLDYDVITEVDIVNDVHRLVTYKGQGPNTLPYSGKFQAAIRVVADNFMDEENYAEYLAKLDFDYMKERLEKEGSYTFILEMQGRDGSSYIKNIKKFQVFYIDEDLGRVGVTRTDVTDVVHKEQKQNEALAAALLAAQQASTAKSEFLSRMSHEIRTPMNAILGMSTIAEQSVGDDEQVTDCIAKIKASSEFLLSLINDILDMSRIESGKMLLKYEPIHLKEFLEGINDICSAQAATKNVDYRWEISSDLEERYLGDAIKLKQVLVNVLSNAIKFTDEGGHVLLNVSSVEKSEDADRLRFVVSDTGRGISEEFLSRIFEPFSQESTGNNSSYGGSGLGLAISKNIVDMMGGKMSVRSKKDTGSEFTIDIRLEFAGDEKRIRDDKKAGVDVFSTRTMQSRMQVSSTEEDYDFTGRRLLLVDDNELNTEVARALLESKGFLVDAAGNGFEAIEKFRESREGYYQAILMDIRMPVMDGHEATMKIRKMDRKDALKVPIIAMTANAFESDIEKSKTAGMDAHLAKPIGPEEMYKTLSELMGGKGRAE
ncbi:MAG: PAS domain-containing protein [Bacillota bacterium]|nr:PAS domain-containing protein [Bacillota bacterium]